MKTVAALVNLRRRPAEYLVLWPSSEPGISGVQNRSSLGVAKLLGVMALERHDRNNSVQLLYGTTQTSAGRKRGKLQTAVTIINQNNNFRHYLYWHKTCYTILLFHTKPS